jgi:hypothetical protein
MLIFMSPFREVIISRISPYIASTVLIKEFLSFAYFQF